MAHLDSRYAPAMGPVKHTSSPMVTGTSILGLKYNGGVMIAADTLASYGSLARFRQISRLYQVNDQVVVAGSGDLADFQYIMRDLEDLQLDNDVLHDGHKVTSKAVYSHLTRVMYGRRNKFDPLWNQLVVAGVTDGKPTLGYVDKIGIAYETACVGTGYGAYIGIPLLRAAQEKNPQMNAEEAKQLLEECMKVMFYRDARASDRIEIANITAEGVTLIPAYSLQTNWEVANMITGYV
eukprot:comp8633_c0_seq1/m.3924 comp8633_c0_seq1/g.3924  ORF comp8633_c0_seq1/g.3924 comp8633_c0_seq1/m.3924 type:complete len:237 (-) comp8633_c0_seq1:91-801(-)